MKNQWPPLNRPTSVGFLLPGETALNTDPILTRLFNKPLFMDRAYARQLFSSVASKMNIHSLNDDNGELALGEKIHAKAFYGTSSGEERYRPYRLTDGVAVVPVSGSLMHKYPYVGMWGMGYDSLIRMVTLAVEDPEVDGIMLDFDSAGGEVAGCFDTAIKLRELGQEKPIAAMSYDMNLSAAMCLAGAAEYRYITQTGEAGSVGVVMAHFSYEEMEKAEGIEVTLIYSGDKKVDGNPYKNLPDEVFARFQKECHTLRGEFATIVGDHLGMDVDDVLATEAAVYRGQAAIDVGFADELINGHEAIAAFRNYLSSQGSTTHTGATMKTDKDKPAPGADGADAPTAEGALTQGQLDAAAASAGSAATLAERERVGGILSNEHAKGREKLAEHLAFKTDQSVEDAAKTMEASGTESVAGDAGRSLDDAMASHGGTSIGPDAAAPEGVADDASRIGSLFNKYTGRGVRNSGA